MVYIRGPLSSDAQCYCSHRDAVIDSFGEVIVAPVTRTDAAAYKWVRTSPIPSTESSNMQNSCRRIHYRTRYEKVGHRRPAAPRRPHWFSLISVNSGASYFGSILKIGVSSGARIPSPFELLYSIFVSKKSTASKRGRGLAWVRLQTVRPSANITFRPPSTLWQRRQRTLPIPLQGRLPP